MKKILGYLKAIAAAVGAGATVIATAAVPDKWKSIAAAIGGICTVISVYSVPNIPQA